MFPFYFVRFPGVLEEGVRDEFKRFLFFVVCFFGFVLIPLGVWQRV